MQCREVKRRLNEKIELNDELLEHIKNCSFCAREVQLAKLLDSALAFEQESNICETLSFDHIKARVIAESARISNEEISFMTKVKKEIESHPGFSFGVAFTLVATAIMLLVPVSYNKTIGYNMAFKGVQTASLIPQDQLLNVARALGYGNARVNIEETDKGYDYEIANLPSFRAAQAMEIAMVELTDNKVQADIKPIVEKVSGNLYAQAKERVKIEIKKKIEIKAKNKTDEKIQIEIRKKLTELGYEPGRIKVKTRDNGICSITLFANDSTGETAFDKDIWLEINGDGDVDIGLVEDHPYAIVIDPENKAADEIKKEIIDKLKAKGVKDPKVEVIQKENGETEIKIKPGKNE